jgi:aminotransferase
MNLEKRVARHLQTIPRSGIRDFFEIVQTMEDVISLGIGEPDFVTPWHIREAAIYALERGRTSYTSNLGLPRLRQAITRYIGRHFGIAYDAKTEVIVTVGVSEALDIALRALINPGDEVLFHEPCYVSYHPTVSMAHGVGVPIATRAEHEFRLRPEDLRASLTARSRVLVLNFPTNPTGATMSADDLREIADICIERDLIVVTDEIYSELTYEGRTHTSIAALPGMRDRTILLHGLSKAFAMTGFRVGFACAPEPLIEAMMKVHQYSILCAPIVSQDAAIEALDNGLPSMHAMRADYDQRRQYIVRELNDMGLECFTPAGAFYAFPKITSTGLTSRQFALGLLERKSVAVVPGSAFGASGEGHVRCSYATSFDNIRKAMTKMREFIAELKVG